MLTALPLSNVIYFYDYKCPKCPWIFATKKIKCEEQDSLAEISPSKIHKKSSIISVKEMVVFSTGQRLPGPLQGGWVKCRQTLFSKEEKK